MVCVSRRDHEAPLAGGCNLLKSFFQIVGLESERSRLALVRDAVISVDQVDAIGPSRIGALGLIVKTVDYCWKLDPEFPHAGCRYLAALVEVVRAGENDFVLEIALSLPNVAWMRLDDVDRKKRDLAVVLVIKLVEGRNLPPEGRSGVTAKDQHHRLHRGEGGQLHVAGLVELCHREIWGDIARLQTAGTRVRPQRFKWGQEEYQVRHVLHHAPEDLGRLVHRPPDVAHESSIEDR